MTQYPVLSCPTGRNDVNMGQISILIFYFEDIYSSSIVQYRQTKDIMSKSNTKSTKAKATTSESKVNTLDPTTINLSELEEPSLDTIIATCKSFIDGNSESPILNVSTNSYAQKSSGKGKSSGKVYETRCAFRDLDGKLHLLGGQFVDEEMGPRGIAGGVKAPKFRDYGMTIMFKTKSNEKLGKAIHLLCTALVMDTKSKLESGEIKSKNTSISNPVKDQLEGDKHDAQTKKDYHDKGDYMVRFRIQTKGPYKTCVYDEKIIDEKIGDDDIELPDGGGFLHTERIGLNEENAHEVFTIGSGSAFTKFGITVKQHGFGISFNLYIQTWYPIPRDVAMDTPTPKTGRSTDARIKHAQKAKERADLAKRNVESIRKRADVGYTKDDDDPGSDASDSEPVAPKRRANKKDKSSKSKKQSKKKVAPVESASDESDEEKDEFSDESE